MSRKTLEIVQGREVVALERTSSSAIIYLNDPLLGGADYEFRVGFHRVQAKPAAFSGASARLNITADVDGSDCIKITSAGATFEHKAWRPPETVTLNDMKWSVTQTNFARNDGTNRFPPGLNFATARIVTRKGRDFATMRSDADGLVVWFADNPDGQDRYELEISFGE